MRYHIGHEQYDATHLASDPCEDDVRTAEGEGAAQDARVAAQLAKLLVVQAGGRGGGACTQPREVAGEGRQRRARASRGAQPGGAQQLGHPPSPPPNGPHPAARCSFQTPQRQQTRAAGPDPPPPWRSPPRLPPPRLLPPQTAERQPRRRRPPPLRCRLPLPRRQPPAAALRAAAGGAASRCLTRQRAPHASRWCAAATASCPPQATAAACRVRRCARPSRTGRARTPLPRPPTPLTPRRLRRQSEVRTRARAPPPGPPPRPPPPAPAAPPLPPAGRRSGPASQRWRCAACRRRRPWG